MTTTTPTIDLADLRKQIDHSTGYGHGIRYPSQEETERTVNSIIARWQQFKGNPRCGEYVKIDGKLHRIAHIYERSNDNEIEFQPAKGGSFYLASGSGSFSGFLGDPVKCKLIHTGWKPASFWLFYGNESGASRGVHFEIPTRVFEVAE